MAARSVVVPLALLLALAGAAGGPRTSQPPAAEAPERAGDEAAIRAADEAFVKGYNAADGKGLAALFTDDADVVEADGSRYRGRDLVEKAFAETFAENKGATIALEVESIRFLSPDVAREEGRSVVTPAGGRGAPVGRRYEVVYVKRGGAWRMASVREDLEPLVRPHDRLKDLEWMVGDWVDEGADAEVRVNCRWSDDGNFLVRSFTVKRAGKPVMAVTQRIGWDPLARQVRSWEFDSEGGFGEGRWSRDGGRWVVKHTGVRPEGAAASATHVMTRERPDLIRWASIDRSLGGDSVPDGDGHVLVRVPPPPQGAAGPKANPNPEPNPNAPAANPGARRTPR